MQASQSFARRTAVLGLGTGFAGAAGDAVTQLGAMAAGRQDGFDLTRSGLAFAGGALGGAVGQAAYDKTCFRAGTPLVWEHGYRQVEEFQVGDRLAARSEFDPEGPIEWKAIEEVFIRRGLILEVTVAGQTIGTTAEHPFYVHGKGWTPAGELRAGDLLAAADGRWLPVESIYNTGALETVYNFRVADHHTYFVGDQDWGFGVWVHNSTYNVHHLQTNKNRISTASGGPYTPKFEALAKRRGTTLNVSMNKVILEGHVGPHPEYNEVVWKRMSAATKGLKGDEFNAAYDAELALIGQLTLKSGTQLNKLATGG